MLDDEDDVLCKNLFSVDNFGRSPKEGAKHGRLASVPDDKRVDVVDSLGLEFGNIIVLFQNLKIQIKQNYSFYIEIDYGFGFPRRV